MPASPAVSFADPAALMRIRNLELRARAVVEGFWRGIHRSPYHGFSSEFTEYRPYVPGDDLRYLDWKLLARSDRACTRKFEDETNVACHLLLDVSRSMDFASGSWSKLEYARTLAASLAIFLERQGDTTGLITFSEGIEQYVPARRKREGRHELMAALGRPRVTPGTALDLPIDHVLRTSRRRGLVILISDLLAPLDALDPKLSALTACGHDVSVYQVLDRAEIEFSFGEAALFEDLETGEVLHVDPTTARARYLDRIAGHQRQLERICNAAGILLHRFPTDEHLESALFTHLSDRARRNRGARRSRQRT